MKIYEVEAGQQEEYLERTVENVVKLLTTQCKGAVQCMQEAQTFMYRGFNTNTKAYPAAFQGAPRTDRRALHSFPEEQEAFDTLIRTYGFDTDRSNSLFCTSKPGKTKLYGHPYLVFPINGFEFLWSPRVRDMFSEDDLGSTARSYVKDWNEKNDQEKMNFADHFVREYKYTDVNFMAALRSGNEIMLNGQYYAFSAKEDQKLGKVNFEPLLANALNIPLGHDYY